MAAPTAKDIAAALNARITDLAPDLLGAPNRSLSSRKQLHFGKHGSVAVELEGDKAGRWFDHERGVGGDGLEMLKRCRGCANGAALDWARQWLGMPPAHGRRKKAPAAPPPDDIAAPDVQPVTPEAEATLERADGSPDEAAMADGAGDGTPATTADEPDALHATKAQEDAKRSASRRRASKGAPETVRPSAG